MSRQTAAPNAQTSYSARLPTALLAIAIATAFAMFYQKNVESHPAPAPAISFVTAPGVLPRDQPAGNYSPLVSIQYSGLEVGTYSLRVHLLETDPQPVGDLCGCTQSPQMWCPATFVINNHNGNNSSGVIVDARITDVHDYQNFLWVADSFKENAGVTSATLSSYLDSKPGTGIECHRKQVRRRWPEPGLHCFGIRSEWRCGQFGRSELADRRCL